MKIKNLIALLLTAVMVLSLTACNAELPQPDASAEPSVMPVEAPPAQDTTPVVETGYSPQASKALSDLVVFYGKDSPDYDGTAYVVCDFDNTTAIFDITYQCAAYQLRTMAFAMDPDGLRTALSTDLDLEADDNADWIEDIIAAYTYLYETYGPFTAAGVDEDTAATMQADPQWMEFAAKMRAFFYHVEDTVEEAVGYSWALWWYCGMTEQEVYDLFYRSCALYQGVETQAITWTSPAEIESRVGVVECTFTDGVSVAPDVAEMLRSLREGGIDVWICSASHADGVRAAVDAFGLSDVVTGVIGMTQQLADGVFVPAYDYETGCSYDNAGAGVWEKTEYAVQALPGMEGKVKAIENALMPRYDGHGPIAGFMDSTGDFNFCTEFESLKLVVCYNRANGKLTDGAGLIAAVAMYQREELGYDLEKANAEGDTLYILQGRDENGLRTLRASDETVKLGETEARLFATGDLEALVEYAAQRRLNTQQLIDCFCI